MNQQPYGIPPRHWPSRLNPQLVRLCGPLRRRTLNRKQQIRRIVVTGDEGLRRELGRGSGVLITPNHAFHYDSYVLMESARRVGQPFHFLTAWQVFVEHRRWQRRLLQWHGCLSVDREGSDLAAFRQAVRILADSASPLVVFPEGDVYHLNDRVTRFREGAAAIAFAAARRAERRIVCIPCALKFWYLEDPTPQLAATMDRLERALHWRPRSELPLRERVARFAEGLLGLKECEYLGSAQRGPLPWRADRLATTLVERLEGAFEMIPRTRGLPERVQRLRAALIKRLAGCRSAGQRRQLEHQLEDLFFVTQLYSYPGGYAGSQASIERLAETIDKFEEDVLKVAVPGVRGVREVHVRYGEPHEAPLAPASDAAGFADQLAAEVQRLLDQLNQERQPLVVAASGA